MFWFVLAVLYVLVLAVAIGTIYRTRDRKHPRDPF